MPSGAYGRGGGNFVKKPKPAPTPAGTAKSNTLKSSEKVSLLKKIAHAMPGSQSKTARRSASQPPRDIPTRHMNPRQTHGDNSPAHPYNNFSHPPIFPGIPPRPIMDTARRNMAPTVNLNTITPSSTEDESSDSGNSEPPLSPIDILPFTSRPMSTDNEGTAVNETPFSAPTILRISKGPFPTAGNRVRSTSMSEGLRRRTTPFPPKLEDSDQNAHQKALAILEGKLGGSSNEGNVVRHLASTDNKFKRGRRITISTPAVTRTSPPRRPISELSSFSDLTPSKLHENTRRWSENIIPGPTPSSDPFNHLFTSCAISLILLIVLAAGKDVLYVVALLPVLMTLAKNFLDLNQLGLYTPLMRKNLESLLSI